MSLENMLKTSTIFVIVFVIAIPGSNALKCYMCDGCPDDPIYWDQMECEGDVSFTVYRCMTYKKTGYVLGNKIVRIHKDCAPKGVPCEDLFPNATDYIDPPADFVIPTHECLFCDGDLCNNYGF